MSSLRIVLKDLKVVNNCSVKIKMESVTLQRTCEIQFVNRAWFGELNLKSESAEFMIVRGRQIEMIYTSVACQRFKQ